MPGLVVVAVALPDGDREGAWLGSTETDDSGRFTIDARLPTTERASVVVAVASPETSGQEFAPHDIGRIATGNTLDVLFVSKPRPVDPDGHEAYRILIDNAALDEAQVKLPEAESGGERLALRSQRLVDELASTERGIAAALAPRIADQRALETGFRTAFLPDLLAGRGAPDITKDPDFEYQVTDDPDRDPATLSRMSIGRGLAALLAEDSDAPSPAADERIARPERRLTRFFFTDDQLAQLDELTAPSDNGDGFTEIAEQDLFDLLGTDAERARRGDVIDATREEALFDAFVEETFEERCASQLLDDPASSTDSTDPADPDPTDPDDSPPATRDTLIDRLGDVTDDIDAPLPTLAGRADEAGLVTAIRDFALPVGPADKPRIFDFETLQIAFDDVWQSVIDRRIEPLARALFVQTHRVLGATGLEPVELDTLDKVKRAVADAALAVKAAPITTLYRRFDPDDPGGGTPPIPDEPPNLPPPRPDRPHSPKDEIEMPSGGSDPSPLDGTAEELIDQLDKILAEPYEFTAFGADRRSRALNFGLVVGYRHVMTPVTYQAGDLVNTVTLAPGEVREYTTKTVTTRKRAEKELMKNSSVRTSELEETNRAESEIVRKAAARTNFSMAADGSYSTGFFSASTNSTLGRDASKTSDEVKRHFHQAVLKASEELRRERSLEVSFEDTITTEHTVTGKLHNANDELLLTILMFELQRRFRVNETIQRAQPVVLVAQDIPSPDEIDEGFVLSHAWVLKRVLLDDGFAAALDYVCESLAGDRFELQTLEETLRLHKRQVADLRTQLVALEEQAGRRYEALLAAVDSSIREEQRESDDGFLSDIKQGLFGGGQSPETARLREDAAREAEQRAAEKAKEMAAFLQRGVNALNEATEKHARVLRRFRNMQVQIGKLLIHLKTHLMFYLQAIWSYEVADQRFLRLYQTPVPSFATQQDVPTRYRRINERAPVSKLHVDLGDTDGDPAAEVRIGVDFELQPSIEMLPPEFDRPLVEVADLSNLLGFMGNYLVFPMRRSNALTDLMLNPYLDEGLRLLDPHDPGNITRPEFAEYICRLRETLTDEQFEAIREPLRRRYRELLLSSEYAGDEIVVPSGALFIEALPGRRPLLEDFKLAHRALDVVAAQEAARGQAIENLRVASRIVDGDFADPDIDALYQFNGAGSVVAPSPGGTDGGSGRGPAPNPVPTG